MGGMERNFGPNQGGMGVSRAAEADDKEAGGETLVAEPTDVVDKMAVGDDYDLDKLYEDEQGQPEEEDEVEPEQTEW